MIAPWRKAAAKEDKQTCRLPQAGRALAHSRLRSPWPRLGTSRWMGAWEPEGQARGCGPSGGRGTGTQLGGSTSPRCFPFTLFTGFKNDFIVENEQTQPDLSGPTHTGDAHRGTQAHVHICPEAHRRTRVHTKKPMRASDWGFLVTGSSLGLANTAVSEVASAYLSKTGHVFSSFPGPFIHLRTHFLCDSPSSFGRRRGPERQPGYQPQSLTSFY